MLRSTKGFFDGKSPLLVAALGLAFIAVVTVLDYLIGLDLSLSLLYLMPIGLITWNLGRRWGAVAVVVFLNGSSDAAPEGEFGGGTLRLFAGDGRIDVHPRQGLLVAFPADLLALAAHQLAEEGIEVGVALILPVVLRALAQQVAGLGRGAPLGLGQKGDVQ